MNSSNQPSERTRGDAGLAPLGLAEVRAAQLIRTMRRRIRNIAILAGRFLAAYIASYLWSLRAGQTDYQRVLSGSEPRFAWKAAVITDGGSAVYQGVGYRVVRVHSFRDDDPHAYKTGAILHYQLRWLFPVFDSRPNARQVQE